MTPRDIVNIKAPELPLSREAFRRALATGHGRALRHVREFGVDGLEDDLVDACLHNRVFDTQCEDGREEWLFQLIGTARLADRVLEAIAETAQRPYDVEKDGDHAQICALLGVFGKNGTRAAGQHLREIFDADSLSGAEYLLELEGPKGLTWILREVREFLEEHEDEIRCLLDYAEGVVGKAEFRRILQEEAGRDLRVATFLQRKQVAETLDESQPGERMDGPAARLPAQQIQELSAHDVIAEIQDIGYSRCAVIWGRSYASPEDLERVVDEIVTEPDPRRIAWYLECFRYRAPPRLDDRLLSLVHHAEPRVRRAAYGALGKLKAPRIRELLFEQLGKPGENNALGEGVLDLLLRNYEPGDYRWLQTANWPWSDACRLHWALSDVVDVFEANCTPESAWPLLFAYEFLPCTNCRRRAVETLLFQDVIPPWVVKECKLDATESIRALV